GDLARRAYWIRLDARVARPWQRTAFRHPRLRRYVREHRTEILTALLTMARYWFASGRPTATVPMVGGFEPWAMTVGGILVAAGLKGFLENLDDLYQTVDDDEPEWIRFLTAWFADYKDQAQTVSALVEDLQRPESRLAAALPGDLDEARKADGKKGSFAKKLGKALGKRDGAVFETYRLQKAKLD